MTWKYVPQYYFLHVFFAVSLEKRFEESPFRDTNPLILMWRHYTAKLVGFPVVIRYLLTATLPLPAFFYTAKQS